MARDPDERSFTFEIDGEPRPVNEDVVLAYDSALERLGGDLLHAIDPRRIVGFASGGPAVWSVGMVAVPGARPYTLLVTYGMSHVLAPEACREGVAHEHSIAVPAGTDPAPWADALLRHLCRYQLAEGKPLANGDVMPTFVPITRVPFQPEHHAKMPDTSLVGIVVVPDPVLPVITTPRGEVEVRRFAGIDQAELDRAETWSPASFGTLWRQHDPLLLTDLARASLMDDPAFRDAAEAGARAEGSTVPAILLDVAWEETAEALVIELPGGREAQKLLDALRGRVGFGRQLVVVSNRSAPIAFRPGAEFDISWSQNGLILVGDLDEPNMAQILSYVRPDAGGGIVRLPLSA